ncbi:hypothetical protein GCM10009564_06540 [Streptomyces thermogriseus]|uniref:Uncharacterized protein n=1 Tax=Streptomyces thermogriseus TaxID=75292 RepID=A0ABP4DDU4_9ACTN
MITGEHDTTLPAILTGGNRGRRHPATAATGRPHRKGGSRRPLCVGGIPPDDRFAHRAVATATDQGHDPALQAQSWVLMSCRQQAAEYGKSERSECSLIDGVSTHSVLSQS